MPTLSRTVLCGTIVACLSSASTVEALLPRRGIEAYDSYRQKHSSVIMIGVLLVLIIFAALFVLLWHRSRRTEDSAAPCHSWQDLEKQKAMHNEVFQNVELGEPAPVVPSTEKNRSTELSKPAPVVHSTKKKRSTDTWDKYLSMIKSPSRLNSVVGKMSTMNE